ncbi:carboxypeptidase-like regulatory domain-containing protein [Candidatus Palauibacter sp.]|uniref:carboxypeptidase-like regulatory domain-containing protein n=1 Tax=Candidatus Palauibacter sp. TaxID=3101350 RepID=UPI003B524C98
MTNRSAGLGLALLALSFAAQLPAQEVGVRLSGLLLTEGSGAPVEGAHIRLVDPADSVFAEALSDARGAFSLPMPPAGVYRLLVGRIGYRSWASDTLHVEWTSEWRALRLDIPVEPIPLPELSVSEENVCPTTAEERERAFALYESMLPILATVSHTEDLGTLRMWIVQPKTIWKRGTFRRGWDTLTVDVPKALSNASPEHLVARGYAGVVDTLTTFYAPDGDALVAPGFLATHCLRPVESEDKGTVGLGFEPKPGRDVVDVEGVLWIDTVPGGPRELEFRYTSLRPWVREHLVPWLRLWFQGRYPDASRMSFSRVQINESHFGGVLRFAKIPDMDDRWLISEWSIDRPVLGFRAGTAYREGVSVWPRAYPITLSGEVLAIIPP